MNQNFRHFIVFIILLGLNNELSAQTFKKSTKERLETRSLGNKASSEYADTPKEISSLSASGDISVSVPLFTINSIRQSIPINANYTPGIKIDQRSSDIGLGWDLNFGSISRDIGAFQPDYSVQFKEEDGTYGANAPGLNHLHSELSPSDNYNRYLQYTEVSAGRNRDVYNLIIPGKGSFKFMDFGDDGTFDFRPIEKNGWRVEAVMKTFTYEVPVSRINELNLQQSTYNANILEYDDGSCAMPNAMLPYVKTPFPGFEGMIGSNTRFSVSLPWISNEYIEPKTIFYEDIGSFVITAPDGFKYYFDRSLIYQKYLFDDDPFWSVATGADYDALQNGVGTTNRTLGEWWKIDYIGKWLLSKIISPDYVDKNGNNQCDNDDAGDWIVLNYDIPTQEFAYEGDYKKVTIPRHRDWINFSATDIYSSLYHETTYLTSIQTPTEEIVASFSPRLEIDQDYYTKPRNYLGSGQAKEYPYEDAMPATDNSTLFTEINYPVEICRYDAFRVFQNGFDKYYDGDEKELQYTIKLDYAEQGAENQLALSEYMIRDVNNVENNGDGKNGEHFFRPSDPKNLNINNYHYSQQTGTGTPRGKTTLLSITKESVDDNQDAMVYSFDYDFNPSFSDIHKREIVKKRMFPSVRHSTNDPAPQYDAEYVDDFVEPGSKNNAVEFLSPFPWEMYVRKTGNPDNISDLALCNESLDYMIEIQSITTLTNITLNKNNWDGETGGNADGQYELPALCDVLGYYVNPDNTEADPNVDKTAWTMTKVHFPTGKIVSFQFESDQFDDQHNWALSDYNIPLIRNYNLNAEHYSIVQDAINQTTDFTSSDVLEPLLPAGFNMKMDAFTGGLRLKSLTVDNGFNRTITKTYEYGDGHYTAVPSDFWNNLISAWGTFHQFELARHSFEEIHIYKDIQDLGYGTSYINQFSNFAGGFSLDNSVNGFHYYDYIREDLPNGSSVEYDYESSNNVVDDLGAIHALNADQFFVKTRTNQFMKDDTYAIVQNPNAQTAPKLYRKMYFANTTTPYKITEYESIEKTGYVANNGVTTFGSNLLGPDNHVIPLVTFSPSISDGLSIDLPYSLHVELTGHGLNLFGMKDWLAANSNHHYSLGLEAEGGQLYYSTTNKYMYTQAACGFDSKQEYLPQRSVNPLVQITKQSISETTTLEGVESFKEYTYDVDYPFLLRKIISTNSAKPNTTGGYNADQSITSYKYEFENTNGMFLSKNILNAPSTINTYLNTESANSVLDAKAFSYNYDNYLLEKSYKYLDDGHELKPDGTYQNFTPLNFGALPEITGASNLKWRTVSKNVYNANGQPSLSWNGTDKKFSKNLYNDRHNLTSTIANTEGAFDAVYNNWELLEDDYSVEDIPALFSPYGSKWFKWEKFGSSLPDDNRILSLPFPTSEVPTCTGFNRAPVVRSVAGFQVGDVVLVSPSPELVDYFNQNGGAPAWQDFTPFQAEILNTTSVTQTYSTPPINDPNELAIYTTVMPESTLSEYDMALCLSYIDPAVQGIIPTLAKIEKIEDNNLHLKDFCRLVPYPKTGQNSLTIPRSSDSNTQEYQSPIRPLRIYAINDPNCTACDNNAIENYEISLWGALQSQLFPTNFTNEDLNGTLSSSSEGVQIKWALYEDDFSTIVSSGSQTLSNLENKKWKLYRKEIAITRSATHDRFLYVWLENNLSAQQFPGKRFITDDILVRPTGSIFTYSSHDDFRNVISTTNTNYRSNKSIYDAWSRPIFQYDFKGVLVNSYEYDISNNLASKANSVRMKTYLSSSDYNIQKTLKDGASDILQHISSEPGRNLSQFGGHSSVNTMNWTDKTYLPYASYGIGSQNSFQNPSHFTTGVPNYYDQTHVYSEITYLDRPEKYIANVTSPYAYGETPSIVSYDYGTNDPSVHVDDRYMPSSLFVNSTTDAEGNTTEQYIDLFGNMVLQKQSTYDHTLSASGATTQLTSGAQAISKTLNAYDGMKRLQQTTDPEGVITTYKYNSYGQPLEVSSDKGVQKMRYDKFGRLRFTQNAKQAELGNGSVYDEVFSYFKYDAWNNVIETGEARQYAHTGPTPFDQNPVSNSSWINDPDFPETGFGNLLVIPISKQTYSYYGSDIEGNRYGKMVHSVQYDYGLTQNQSPMAPNNTLTTDYELIDNNGRMLQVANTIGSLSQYGLYRSFYEYDRVGNVTKKTFLHELNDLSIPFDFRTDLEYDNMGRLISISTRQHAQPVITEVKNSYDALGVLVQSDLGWEPTGPPVERIKYGYDIQGNLTDQVSEDLKFHLDRDLNFNITDQYWISDQFDPAGTGLTTHQYLYKYDDMKRLIGAQYMMDYDVDGGSLFNYSLSQSDVPEVVSCDPIVVVEIQNALAEISGMIEDADQLGIQVSQQLKDDLTAYVDVIQTKLEEVGSSFANLNGREQETLLNDILRTSGELRIDVAALEAFNVELARRSGSKDIPDAGNYDFSKTILNLLRVTIAEYCYINENSNSFNHLANVFDGSHVGHTLPSDKYDTGYRYGKNGRMENIARRYNDPAWHNIELEYATDRNYKISQTRDIDGAGSESFSYNHTPDGSVSQDEANENALLQYHTFNENPAKISIDIATLSPYTEVGERVWNSPGNTRIMRQSYGKISGTEDILTTDFYIGDAIIAANGKVKRVNTAAGYVEETGTTLERYYQVSDWLGNIRTVEKEDNTIQMARDYYPYGLEMPGRVFQSGQESSRIQFQAHERDADVHYDYHTARYYDPVLGNYLSVDPLADHPNQIGMSPYSAFWNNPIRFTDPDGRCPDCPDPENASEGDVANPNGTREYTFTNGEWVGNGGTLDEVVVEYELTLQERGNLWMKKNFKYSYEDAERMIVEDKGYDYDLYKKINELEFPKGGNSTSQAEDLADMAIFVQDYTKKSEAYNSFAREYTGILFSDQPMLKKVDQLRTLMDAYTPPNVTQQEIENKFYELNPALEYLRDE